MSSLKVRLFGKFSVEREAKELKKLDACKEQELFCYLLIYRNRPHPRENLASLLWGNCTTSKSKKYLRQTIWHIQKSLETNIGSNVQSVFHVEHDWVQLKLDSEIELDVADFEQAFATVEGIPGAELNEENFCGLQDAVSLYKGDLLEGWYQDWCIFERERLQNIYLTMLGKIMGYCKRHRLYDKGRVYGSLILRYDRASERTHRLLMQMQYLSGDRTAALRQYDLCASALEEELSVKPGKLTRAVYERICADQIEDFELNSFEENTTPPSELLDRLKRLQTFLSEAERRIRHEIKAVEMDLKAYKAQD